LNGWGSWALGRRQEPRPLRHERTAALVYPLDVVKDDRRLVFGMMPSRLFHLAMPYLDFDRANVFVLALAHSMAA
jgi:hypothetical protein